MVEPTDPHRWLDRVVLPPGPYGPPLVAIQVETVAESYTVEQAKGIRNALDAAIEEAEEMREEDDG